MPAYHVVIDERNASNRAVRLISLDIGSRLDYITLAIGVSS